MDTKPCPLCGAALVKEYGAVSELRWVRWEQTPRRIARPAWFWSCWTCEHCEEA